MEKRVDNKSETGKIWCFVGIGVCKVGHQRSVVFSHPKYRGSYYNGCPKRGRDTDCIQHGHRPVGPDANKTTLRGLHVQSAGCGMGTQSVQYRASFKVYGASRVCYNSANNPTDH